MSSHYSKLLAIAVGLMLTTSYMLYLSGFYFGDASKLGEDYVNFFVRMSSAEFYFRTAGFFHIPWFTPAMCAGGFQFANPIDVTYSIPQLLSLLTNPLVAVYLTHALFVLLGGIGTYLLATTAPFRLSIWPAIATATMFALNGFFMAHMITGHLNFHTFMLLPFIAWLLLQNRSSASVVAGAIAAVVVVGGGAHLVIPVGISILSIVLLARQFKAGPKATDMATAISLSCSVALSLSAAKLMAGYSLLSNFPRSLYELQGITTVAASVWTPLTNFFWDVSVPSQTHGNWLLGSHEYELSLSPFVLPGFVIALWIGIKSYPRSLLRYSVLMAPLVALIILVNFYQPAWHEILKQLPIVSNSISLFRWYASFLLLGALIAGMGIQRLPAKWIITMSVIIIIGTSGWQVFSEPPWKTLPKVDYTTILAGLESSRLEGITPITTLAVNTNGSGETLKIHTASDVKFTRGESQIFCYEPILGYRAERLNIDNLRIGAVTTRIGNELNMKNPACYLFPQENQCAAGDNFTLAQTEQMLAFTHYRAWPFEQPTYQSLANWASLFSWIALSIFLLWLAVSTIRRKARLNSST